MINFTSRSSFMSFPSRTRIVIHDGPWLVKYPLPVRATRAPPPRSSALVSGFFQGRATRARKNRTRQISHVFHAARTNSRIRCKRIFSNKDSIRSLEYIISLEIKICKEARFSFHPRIEETRYIINYIY